MIQKKRRGDLLAAHPPRVLTPPERACRAPSQRTYAAHERLRCARSSRTAVARGRRRWWKRRMPRGGLCGTRGLCVPHKPPRGAAPWDSHTLRCPRAGCRWRYAKTAHIATDPKRVLGLGASGSVPKELEGRRRTAVAVCRRPRHAATAARRRKWRGHAAREGMGAGWHGASWIPLPANAELSPSTLQPGHRYRRIPQAPPPRHVFVHVKCLFVHDTLRVLHLCSTSR